MKVASILKVGDIESHELTPHFIEWLNQEITPTYNDNEGLNEHLFNIDTIMENYEEGEENDQFIWDALHQIKNLLAVNDCGYFRIIY